MERVKIRRREERKKKKKKKGHTVEERLYKSTTGRVLVYSCVSVR